MSELPQGFLFAGTSCGVKPSGKPDLALIATTASCVMAGVYTQNIVCATSIDWNRSRTPSDNFRAIIINSGNANACTGQQGQADNEAMAQATASLLDAKPSQVGVLSTGVIGVKLPMEKISSGIASLTSHSGDSLDEFEQAAEAITTTDKSIKTCHGELELGGQTIRISAMAKGAGMIGPNMATMLAIVCTDANLNQETAQTLIQTAANKSFNQISVEGHTSTNDALMLMCSGHSQPLEDKASLDAFSTKLNEICIELAKQIPADGEGASHLVEINVSGADSNSAAEQIARTVAASNLVKTAITGNDPNWGRIVSAVGYSGVPIDLTQLSLKLNGGTVFEKGEPAEFDAAGISQSLKENFESVVEINLGSGAGSCTHWTSDLTVDYVNFNSEYTT